MRADAILAERHEEVRAAGRAWHKAGAIDDQTLEAIVAEAPDDRSRLGPVFRFLVFVFTVIAVIAALGLAFLVLSIQEETATGVLLLLLALGLAALTEIQIGPLKRSGGGAEAATAFLAVTFAASGLLTVLRWTGTTTAAHGLALSALLFGLAAWRWGFPAFAGLAALWFYLWLGQLPWPRVLWGVVGTALALALLPATRAVRLAPSHRRSVAVVVAASIVAVYVAVHFGSWDHAWIEALAVRGVARPEARGGARALFAAATALVPIVVLAGGVFRRDRLLLNLGAVLAVSSLATLRFYVHVAPAWVVLTASGLAAMGAALLLRRFLASSPDGARAGFTAEPLYEDARQRALLESVAVAATATPAIADRQPDLDGKGGRFGGGGASTTY